jgi:GAF domain-containing protein
VVSYLGVPIVSNKWIVGVLCVFDDEPREWDTADVGMLTQLAALLSRTIGNPAP